MTGLQDVHPIDTGVLPVSLWVPSGNPLSKGMHVGLIGHSKLPFFFFFSSRRTDLQTYWDYKQASQSYQQAWQQLRRQAFPLWPRCDRDLLLFR